MKRQAAALAAAVLILPPASRPVAAQAIRGFPAGMVPAQHERERAAWALPDPDTLRSRLQLLSEAPHHAGSPMSREVAERVLARFRSFGLDARIERFEAMMPVPVSRTAELLGPERYALTLAEPAIPEDKDSGDAGQLPTYNAYSPDGDVTGEVVFVNYGTPEDYAVLDSLGISVRGRIVLARYGRSWRGIKPKVAAEHGAIATLIYSDPRDDGYWVGDVYPKGPMRPEFGVQRGSVMDMPRYPGDPQSPGWASEEGAPKLPLYSVQTLSPIPVLPISYGDALPILRGLEGPVAPPSWRGALPITYHMGPGPSRMHVALRFDWRVRPLYDVIATIPGQRWPDEWVIFGNHHDAWVNGAEDPLSGLVAVEEMGRSLGALLKTGWRPERTIKLAAWDGEEWGLLGSTEWAEKHADELKRNVVAYINSDTNNRGWLGVSGSHSLQTFVREIARDVVDPKSGGSVLDALQRRRAGSRAGPVREPADTAFSISALGSGSDYTVFLDHLGLPSLNMAYGGGAEAGIYHSIYDSFAHYTRFMDTTFAYGVAEARTLATAALRLADAPVLPFEFVAPAATYRGYLDEIEMEARAQPETANLDLSAVRAAIDRLDEAAARYEAAYARVADLSEAVVRRRSAELAALNRLLRQSEQALSAEIGLPQRDWFRHLMYAPGFYTGYGVKTMPGIREAVEDVPDAVVAEREAARVAYALDRYAEQVDQAAQALERLQ